MANSSASSISNSSGPKSSRFSTFKSFKLTRGKTEKPPPPPPKDPYYLRNRSLASLSPDSFAIPSPSPLSPNSQILRRPSPDVNQSTMSLVSSSGSCPPDDPRSSTRQRDKKLPFFRLKRSPKSPLTKSSSESDALPPIPTEDENISLPWNFQHNIHVDEGFTGMPPSWATSLAQAGFTATEIADMQSRRTGGNRSPSSTYFFSDRPESPSYSTTALPAPVVTHPSPRSTSLFRKYSDASLTSTTHSGRQSPPPPPLPTHGPRPTPSLRSVHSNTTPSNGITKNSPHHQGSAERGVSHHPSTSSFSVSRSLDSQSHHSNGTTALTQDGTSNTSSVAFPPRAELSELSTPPRRYHITNNAIVGSPPPSYTQFSSSTPRMNIELVDKKSGSSRHPSLARNTSSMSQSHNPSKSSDSSRSGSHHTHGFTSSGDHSTPSSSSNSSPAKSTPQIKPPSLSNRLTALPPRLSLHTSNDSTDLSIWGEALLSGISLASVDTTPNTSTFAAAQDTKPLSISVQRKPPMNGRSDPPSSTPPVPARPSPRHKHQRSRENVPPRLPPPTRPIPPVVVNGRHVNGGKQPTPDSEQHDVPPPSSAWFEPASSARSEPSGDRTGNTLGYTSPTSTTPHFLSALGNVVNIDPGREQQTNGVALPESRSPILPIPPEAGDQDDLIEGERADPEAVAKVADEDTIDEDEMVRMLSADRTWARDTNRDSSRSSTSTVTVTGFMEPPTIVRNVSVARRAGAYVTKVGIGRGRERVHENRTPNGTHTVSVFRPLLPASRSNEAKHPPSPLSSTFSSEDGSGSGSVSSSSMSQDHRTPTTEDGTDSPLTYYMNCSSSSDPSKISFLPKAHHHLLISATDTFGGVHKEDEDIDIYEGEAEEEEEEGAKNAPPGTPSARPKIVINDAHGSSGLATALPSGATASPLSPFQRYRGWLSEVVAPLEEFIDEAVDPRDYYLDLQEIAEGESGSVYAARLTDKHLHKLKLPPLIKAQDGDDLTKGRTTLVAIKSVAILPSGSSKLGDLEKELTLMRGLRHDNVLSMDAVYVDLVEDALWIRMELMERSLADLVGLIKSGLMLQERMMLRFASDVLQALEYLESHGIAHRDVRSDNLLVNSHGILKLTDFSNAVQVTRESPMRSEIVGVVYWQAPEIRSPPYNALKVDVWSLGATVWEMAETEPPFADMQQVDDRWPPLSRPEIYSPAFRDFLRQCSEPPATRPTASELKKSPLINNACGRPVIIQLLSQCMAIEQALRDGEVSHGPTSE